MARIRELQLKDVRCFKGAQSACLGRRITLLVGENSTGKSTFLGCYNAFAKLANLDNLAEQNHFDEAPFYMGEFDSIVRSGKSKFSVGGSFEDHCHKSALFSFRKSGRRPVDRQLQLSVADSRSNDQLVRITSLPQSDTALRFSGPGFTIDFTPLEFSFDSIASWLSRYARHGYLPFGGDLEIFRARTHERRDERESEFIKFINFFHKKEFPFPEPNSFTVNSPDPVLPERVRSYLAPPEHLSGENDDSLLCFLGGMGKKLNLWNRISLNDTLDTIRTEVRVDTPNGSHNMIDVGYGIHSLVYLMAEIYRQPQESVILLQQPEIHIHPKAQADLAQWMAESGRSFMIETHGDHFIDRFRICVMNGILSPEDLSIVFFQSEQNGECTKVHSIGVDKQGNLEGAPPAYRSFFLDEARSLFGFD